MEKSLPLLLIGLFIVPRRLIQRFQELFAAFLSRSSTQHLIKKHLHRLIVRDDIFVIMWHKKSPPYGNPILYKPALIESRTIRQLIVWLPIMRDASAPTTRRRRLRLYPERSLVQARLLRRA